MRSEAATRFAILQVFNFFISTEFAYLLQFTIPLFFLHEFTKNNGEIYLV